MSNTIQKTQQKESAANNKVRIFQTVFYILYNYLHRVLHS